MTPTTPIIIQGLTFHAPQPYAQGHVLTANEATALNALLAENLRNNFTRRVKARANGRDLAPEDGAAYRLRSEFATYAAQYRLGTGTTPPRDPVAREATRLATSLVREWLNRRNVQRGELAEGEFDSHVARIAALPATQAEARRRVEASRRELASALDILDTPAA
jgi:hypothetical protein